MLETICDIMVDAYKRNWITSRDGSNNDKQYTMWKRNTDRIFNYPQVQYGS